MEQKACHKIRKVTEVTLRSSTQYSVLSRNVEAWPRGRGTENHKNQNKWKKSSYVPTTVKCRCPAPNTCRPNTSSSRHETVKLESLTTHLPLLNNVTVTPVTVCQAWLLLLYLVFDCSLFFPHGACFFHLSINSFHNDFYSHSIRIFKYSPIYIICLYIK